MTDRELLELAAKAAGHKIIGWDLYPDFEVAILDDLTRWQPLIKNGATDCDGDALRLAVMVSHRDGAGFSVYLPDKDDPTAVANVYGVSHVLVNAKHDDPLAATRRAIVRTAAEVGRGMP